MMTSKPLPSFQHRSIGRKSHAPRTAYAHVNYITREDACSHVQGQHMPVGRDEGARSFFDAQAEREGVHPAARVCDKLMIALPREMTAEQRHAAVESFMEKLGGGRIAWIAAHHDMGKDAANPHVHIALLDRDVETGRKVLGTTTNSKDVKEAEAKGWKVPPRTTTADLRAAWCSHINHELERAGIDLAYDPRKLKEQGIEREAQIHEGPKARAMEASGKPLGQAKEELTTGRFMPFAVTDEGTRMGYNRAVKERNARRELVGGNHATARELTGQEAPPKPVRSSESATKPMSREAKERNGLRDEHRAQWVELRGDQKADRDALRQLHGGEAVTHKAWGKQLYATARQAAYTSVGQLYQHRLDALGNIENRTERAAMRDAVKREMREALRAEKERAVAEARTQKEHAYQTMKARQALERRDLAHVHKDEHRAMARGQVAERNGVHEKWEASRADRAAIRETLAYSSGGMVAQQRAALRTAQRAQPSTSYVAAAMHRESMEQWREKASAAREERGAIREALNRSRGETTDVRREVSDKMREHTDRQQRVKDRVREKWNSGTNEGQKDAVKGARDGSER